MTRNPIIEEIRKHREAHAAKFNYDVEAMVEDAIRGQEAAKRAGFKIVDLSRKTPPQRRGRPAVSK